MIIFLHAGDVSRIVNLAHLVSAEMSPRGDVAILTMSVGPQIRVEGAHGLALMGFLQEIGKTVSPPTIGQMCIAHEQERA